MIQKIKTYIFMAMTALLVAVPVIVPVAVYAAPGTCSGISGDVATGASDAVANGSTVDCSATGVDGGSIATDASNLVKIFSIIVGVVAVVMVIVGGFRYITSGGDSGKVGSAKNSLIYAIVGLVIVALAQLIVHFVLNQSSNITGS
jgi:hypothetical protein